MSSPFRSLPRVLPFVCAVAPFAALPAVANDDDLFNSKPGAKPPPPPAKTAPAAAPAGSPVPPASLVATRTTDGAQGVATWQLPGLSSDLPVVTFRQGRYAFGTSGGFLLTSTDGQRWDAAATPSQYAVRQITHDGARWIVLTASQQPSLHWSADGRTWSSNPVWKFYSETLVARDGRFWAAADLFGLGSLIRGRLDAKTDDRERNWDGRLTSESGPIVALESGRHLFLVRTDGQLFSSDNGDYWRRENFVGPLAKVNGALLAEGNGVAVLFVMNGTNLSRDLAAQVQVGADGPWTTVKDVPFKTARGLAYGGGRFVAIGAGASTLFGEPALYESADGTAWTRVAVLDKQAQGVAFGPAGFVIGGGAGKFFVYRPEPLPEKPAFVRAATPVPDIQLKDFGTNYAGSGKYRRETGPQTLDQRRVAELGDMLTKARTGDVAAKRELALATVEGKFAHTNPWIAEAWLKDADAAGDAIAPRGLAMLLAEWKPATPQAELVALYRRGAERGDVPAAVWLAENLPPADPLRAKWRPVASEKDPAFRTREANRARYAEHRAQADAGDPDACLVVAALLFEGDGLPKDAKRAEELLRTAAGKKHPRGMFLLADFIERTASDKAFAVEVTARQYRELLQDAAAAGEPDALRRVAAYSAEGKRTFPKDEKVAYGAYLKLAGQGDAPSMTVVGRVLFNGGVAGVAKDEVAGEAWIRKAVAANDANAKALLGELERMKARGAQRPPLDAKVAGATREVFAALEKIQAAAAPKFDDAALGELFAAVWFDAEYSAADEDLAQELAAAARPLAIGAADGRTLAFAKPIAPEQAANFAQILPAAFNPENLQYYFALWQRTANAGLIVGATRASPQLKTQVENALAQAMYGAAAQGTNASNKPAQDFFAQLERSHAAASPAVQPEFRTLVRRALEQAQFIAKQTGVAHLASFSGLAWLKETAPSPAPAASARTP